MCVSHSLTSQSLLLMGGIRKNLANMVACLSQIDIHILAVHFHDFLQVSLSSDYWVYPTSLRGPDKI